MQYIELEDEWKEKLDYEKLSGSGYDFVALELEDGTRFSATLLNEKRLKVNNNMDLEDIEEIHVR